MPGVKRRVRATPEMSPRQGDAPIVTDKKEKPTLRTQLFLWTCIIDKVRNWTLRISRLTKYQIEHGARHSQLQRVSGAVLTFSSTYTLTELARGSSVRRADE